jgi:hypothetical protein
MLNWRLEFVLSVEMFKALPYLFETRAWTVHCDRNTKMEGGVCIVCRRSFKSSPIPREIRDWIVHSDNKM